MIVGILKNFTDILKIRNTSMNGYFKRQKSLHINYLDLFYTLNIYSFIVTLSRH